VSSVAPAMPAISIPLSEFAYVMPRNENNDTPTP
jgi:hypothetical protein